VLDLIVGTAKVSLQLGNGEIHEIHFPNINVRGIYHIVKLATDGLLQIAGILRRQTLSRFLGRQELLLNIGAGGERHALTAISIRGATFIGIG